MEFARPSGRRLVRFVVAFYTAVALLFFGFYAVIGIFGPFSLMTIWSSVFWPTTLMSHEIHAAFLLVGLGAALVEPRVTEVGN